jgi:flagellar motor switch protein FliM
MLAIVFSEYTKAWSSVYGVEFEYIRSEMNTQFANIATPSEVVVVARFNIELGAGSGDFHVCFPYAMIEPIREILYSSLQGERMEIDDRWARLLARQVQVAEVDLVANLGNAPVTLRQILEMQPGDVISLDVPEAVVAEVDGVPLFECKYGVVNGQYALKVDRVLSPAGEDIPIPHSRKP